MPKEHDTLNCVQPKFCHKCHAIELSDKMEKACENAHKKTVEECKLQNITLEETHENGDVHYTEKAQDIFLKHYDYNVQYKIEVYEDIFSEAQPENTENKKIWAVQILDADTDELYDNDTGYDTEEEARASGEAQIVTREMDDFVDEIKQ